MNSPTAAATPPVNPALQMAPCPKCKQMNSRLSEECLFCDAPLPWAVGGSPAVAPTAAGTVNATAALLGDGPVVMPSHYGSRASEDRFEIWVTLLSFVIPPVGIYLLLSNTGSRPLRARSAGYGVLASVVVWIGFLIFVKLLLVVLGSAG